MAAAQRPAVGAVVDEGDAHAVPELVLRGGEGGAAAAGGGAVGGADEGGVADEGVVLVVRDAALQAAPAAGGGGKRWSGTRRSRTRRWKEMEIRSRSRRSRSGARWLGQRPAGLEQQQCNVQYDELPAESHTPHHAGRSCTHPKPSSLSAQREPTWCTAPTTRWKVPRLFSTKVLLCRYMLRDGLLTSPGRWRGVLQRERLRVGEEGVKGGQGEHGINVAAKNGSMSSDVYARRCDCSR